MIKSRARSCENSIRVEAEFKHRLAKELEKYISILTTDNIYPYLLGCLL